MTLGKSAVYKLEVIEENNERLEAVEKFTNTRMSGMLVMYINNVIMRTSMEILWLVFIVALKISGFPKTVWWY